MLPKRFLGANGPQVGAIGYGAMVLEGYYGSADKHEGIRTIQHALDIGMSLIDTADAYGNGHNETLVAEAIRNRTDDAVVATKCGIVFEGDQQGTEVPTGWGFSLRINGTPRYVRHAVEESLRRLQIETIDLWYLHFPDPAVAISETVGAMAEEVRAGKVRYLGLSNVTPEQVRQAHAVHPVAAVQYEYSLWRREAEEALLPVLLELSIALVPWSPLGSGFLTGTVTAVPSNDFRVHNPKFAGTNFKENLDRFTAIKELAASIGASPAQLSLAWLLHQGTDIVPIPGTRRVSRLDENAKSASLTLNTVTLRRIDELMPIGAAKGATLLP
jgi:aryl-alcohol dehydrogenase-like predicted oxidoreductase